jgi:hypothetical protein
VWTCRKNISGIISVNQNNDSRYPASMQGRPGQSSVNLRRNAMDVVSSPDKRHSRHGLHTRSSSIRHTRTDFSHFVFSMTAPLDSGSSGCPAGFASLERAACSRRTQRGHRKGQPACRMGYCRRPDTSATFCCLANLPLACRLLQNHQALFRSRPKNTVVSLHSR